MRHMSAISVVALERDSARIEEALTVLQAGLGDEYITRAEFLRYVAPEPGSPFRQALMAVDDASQDVVGALLIEIVDADALRASFLGSYAMVRDDSAIGPLRPGRTGLIKSIVVAPEHQGRGIATRLIGHGVRTLTERGAEHCYSLAWESRQNGCHLCGVLTALGFRAVRRIERFWYQDSLTQGYACVLCGRPCTCAVRVMIR